MWATGQRNSQLSKLKSSMCAGKITAGGRKFSRSSGPMVFSRALLARMSAEVDEMACRAR
jgi:methionyl-tRNA synthetase